VAGRPVRCNAALHPLGCPPAVAGWPAGCNAALHPLGCPPAVAGWPARCNAALQPVGCPGVGRSDQGAVMPHYTRRDCPSGREPARAL